MNNRVRSFLIIGLLFIVGAAMVIGFNGVNYSNNVQLIKGSQQKQSDPSRIVDLIQSANDGDKDAQFNLALKYEQGRGVPQNDQQAFKYYFMAAKQTHPTAQLKIAKLYETGKGVDKNKKNAYRYYIRASKQNSSEALYVLGLSHLMLANKPYQYKNTGLSYLKRAAAQGHIMAKFVLSKSKRRSDIVSLRNQGLITSGPTYKEAMELLAAGGFDDATAALSDLTENNSSNTIQKANKSLPPPAPYKVTGRTERQNPNSLAYVREFARAENAASQYEIGRRYLLGQSVLRNLEKSYWWFKDAAIQGHAEAQDSLATAYLNATGTKKNVAKALYWYKQAGNQGNADAMFSLGIIYAMGEDTEKNMALAIIWLRKSAKAGSYLAQEYITDNGRFLSDDDAKSRLELYIALLRLLR